MATSTARDVLNDALRDMGILSEYEDMTADQGATGLRVLNNMLFGFNAEGINYGHTILATLDGVLNVPDELVRSVGLMLVRNLGPRNGYMPPLDQMMQIEAAKRALQAYYFDPGLGVVDSALAPRSGPYGITRLD